MQKKAKQEKQKRQKEMLKASGITLIALVVTLVVLLILAGVTINAVLGDNGIFSTAREAANKFNEAQQAEEEALENLVGQLDNILNDPGSSEDQTDPEKPEAPTPENSNGSFSSEKGVNTPKLVAGMTPVVWDGTANSGQGAWVEAESVDEWYNYKTTAVNGTQAKQWANAMTSDGSLWVWIPRYAYQIASGYHTNSTTGGTINIEFLQETTNTGATGKTIVEYNASTTNNYANFPNGYVVHPGFEYSSTASGLWVAKFEASQSDAGVNEADYANSTGGTSGVIKIQPGVNSWRNITIGEAYTKCLSYAGTTLGNTSLNSHLMKNTEWGACAYLSRSEYGKNEEIWINPNSNYITGQAGTGVSVSSTSTTYPYTNEQYGVQASTTGNIYGIYDMSGGSPEYTAAYIDNSYVKEPGTSGAASSNNRYEVGEALIKGANYTKNIYTDGTVIGSEDGGQENYDANKEKFGDAVYETSARIGTTRESWYQDTSAFPSIYTPFFIRGAGSPDGTGSGLFSFYVANSTIPNQRGFRPVLSPLP